LAADDPPTEAPLKGAPYESSSGTLARSAASAGAATMTSRILGLVRDQVLSHYFGASDAMDAYRVGFRFPNLFRDLFAEGAMSAAFVPTFTRHLAESGKPSAWRLANLLITTLVVITGAIAVIGILFAEPLVTALAGKYAAVPGKLELTITLTRIMFPVLMLIAVAAAVMGMLNSLRHFFIPALSPAMFNVVTIAAAVLVVPFVMPAGVSAQASTLGDLKLPIIVIAMSTVLGGVAQVALQAPTLLREGFRFRPILDWKDPGLQRVLLLMGPGTLGLAATQINLMVNMFLATGEGKGAQTWLDLAFRLMYLPIGLFGVSIATAVLPTVSRHVVAGDTRASRETVADGLALMMALNVPATVGLIVLSVPIVRVIFEHGRFLPSDTLATAAALQFYAIGLVGYSVVRIASPTFYALGRNRTPVIVSVVTVLVNAVLNYVLVRAMGYRGLALGTSVAALFNATVLFVLLRQALDGLSGRRLASSFIRIVAASAVMGIVAVLVDRQLSTALPARPIPWQIVHVSADIAAALGALALSAWILRIKEFNESVLMVLRKVRRAR
jgi:putative peptidoglycan lipid II flippase